jgi:hypothetical protein
MVFASLDLEADFEPPFSSKTLVLGPGRNKLIYYVPCAVLVA